MPYDSIKAAFLDTPEEQMDSDLLPIVQRWDEEPTAIQLLELLDHCIYYSGATDFVVSALTRFLQGRLIAEGKTLQDIIPLATWRVSMPLE